MNHFNTMHDAMALLARAVDQWIEPIENDEPISGAAAVEWLQEFILEARDIVGIKIKHKHGRAH